MAVVGGTGDEGYGLALRWTKHGYTVLIGSRSQDRAVAAAENIRKAVGAKSNVQGLTNNEATAKSDIIVIAVPFTALSDTLKNLKSSFRDGQILINLIVPLESSVGGRATRTFLPWEGSAGEFASRLIPKNVKLVCAFNNVSAYQLGELSKPVECDVLVCGNDEPAKQTVSELVKAIPGLRFIDAGPLDNCRTIEQFTALLVSLNIKYNVKNAGLRITGLPIIG